MGSAKAPCPRTTFTEEGFLVTDNEEVAPCFPLPCPGPAWEAPPQGYFSNIPSTIRDSPTAPLTSDLPAAVGVCPPEGELPARMGLAGKAG